MTTLPRSSDDSTLDNDLAITTSPTLGKIFGALAKAQGAMSNARKDSKGFAPDQGGGRTYDYSTLGSVLDALRGPLSTNELALVQTTTQAGPNGVCVVTFLGHSSGEWIRGELFLPAKKCDAQGFGSAITYARRYAASAITGMAAADDDAGEAVRGDRDSKPENGRRGSMSDRGENLSRETTAPSPRESTVRPVPSPQPAPTRRPADLPDGLKEHEAQVIEDFALKFAAARTHQQIHDLHRAASHAVGGRHGASKAYLRWHQDALRQARAGVGPMQRPGPARAQQAPQDARKAAAR